MSKGKQWEKEEASTPQATAGLPVAKVVEQQVKVQNGKISEFRVHLMVTFILRD